jgi:hypothetical protein
MNRRQNGSTGPAIHDPDASRMFPVGSRVESVSVAGGVATVHVNRVVMTSFTRECDFNKLALTRTLTALPDVTDVVVRQAPAETPGEPDV